jgi:competence ComEA-like helix-hairpin-helix protein
VWLGVAALSWWIARAPAELPALEPRRDAAGACVLAAGAGGEPCACDALPADLRLALGLPLPLARASVEDLERLPGIGPQRAQAIVAERERRPFDTLAELGRVRGIGPATVRSLTPLLFVGSPDPACARRHS